ncbi:hypothetical protein ACFOON_07225 [Novosphingobium piscinae]|uniref:YdhG-like domain-containing protein n=1 Tax=Novosphingobium piscinae TaxID=1507448 RepID=A0A7X1FWW9_9SPHN|nr:hypothetical protein [Novosphingobium piscinae]MBC2668513.1 hypothetical protein [Novosphingobium piscinae]
MDLEPTFAALRALMLDAAADQVVASDQPGDLVLHGRATDPRSGKPVWFGAVTLRARYVAYHLFPLYADPALGAALSPALKRRQQGKSCFNFATLDPVLAAELAELTRQANAAVG